MKCEDRLFEDYQTYLNFLKKISSSDTFSREIADHEQEHFEKARTLGYNPIYGARVVSGNTLIGDIPPTVAYGFVTFEKGSQIPTREDLIQIALAPQKPSIFDLAIAEKLKLSKDGAEECLDLESLIGSTSLKIAL